MTLCENAGLGEYGSLSDLFHCAIKVYSQTAMTIYINNDTAHCLVEKNQGSYESGTNHISKKSKDFKLIKYCGFNRTYAATGAKKLKRIV